MSMCMTCDSVNIIVVYILFSSAGIQCSVWMCVDNEWREIKTMSPPLT